MAVFLVGGVGVGIGGVGVGIGWEHGRIGAWALTGLEHGLGARALAGSPRSGRAHMLLKPPTSATARRHRNPYPGPHEKLHVG